MVDRIERNKDLVQELVESTATHVGRITTIITGAVADSAREVGDLVTDGFEMRDAARRARDDEQRGILDAEIADPVPGSGAADGAELATPLTEQIESTRRPADDISTPEVPDSADGETPEIPQPTLPVTPEVEAEIESEYDG